MAADRIDVSMDVAKPTSPFKTSITHPINVSFMVPPEFLSRSQPYARFRSGEGTLDLLDVFEPAKPGEPWNMSAIETPPTIILTTTEPASGQGVTGDLCDLLGKPLHGNLVLSSCPGKKVRLEGPSKGRARINRDLHSDLSRIAGMGVTTLVCCLDDTELAFLGAPWTSYRQVAEQLGLEVLRLPMVEGSVPEKPEELDTLVEAIDDRIRMGASVLVHCRGGVGRAGLVACCWLIRRGYARTAERAIQLVRARRSPRAIETKRQEDFIADFFRRWKSRNDTSRLASDRSRTVESIRYQHEAELGGTTGREPG